MTVPKSLESLEQQRASIATQIAALNDLRLWLDHFHHGPMRQTQLPLSSTPRSRARPQPPPDLQGQRQDLHRIPARPSCRAKSGNRDR